jgi:hypothetical protein
MVGRGRLESWSGTRVGHAIFSVPVEVEKPIIGVSPS